jgi:diguanylate cyclase (GGDEF)-like protein
MGDSEPPLEETETRNLYLGAKDGSDVGLRRPCLKVLAGADLGMVHRLRVGETTLGRSHRATVRVDDDGASRLHARIVVKEGAPPLAEVEDLGSANGTFVNGERVAKAPLRDGDRIKIGEQGLWKFFLADPIEDGLQRHNVALHDPLTGVFSAAYGGLRMESEIAYAVRYRTQLGLVLADLDDFAKINESHGRDVGDKILALLGRRLQWAVRAEDVLMRLDGDCFGVLCRGPEFTKFMQVAERLRKVVPAQSLDVGGATFRLTVSVGVASMPEVHATNSPEFLDAARRALDEAKRAGGDRVAVAPASSDDEPPTQQRR